MTGEKIKILVVDDEAPIRNLLSRYLTSRGYFVETAEDGTKALEKFASFAPCFVFLDFMMPGMSGLDVLKEIKKRSPNTMVIMVTGSLDAGLAEEVKRVGATELIAKPFRLDQIEKTILEKFKSGCQPT